MSNKLPYKFPIRSRKGMIDFLMAEQGHGWESRGWQGDGSWRFCWNVKMYSLDFSFDNLLKVAVKGEMPVYPDDAGWMERARAYFTEHFGEDGDDESLYNGAVESARYAFVSDRKGHDEPEHDSYQQSLDGKVKYHVRFGFYGRSGGWLVLTEFGLKGGPHYKLNGDFDAAEMDLKTLRHLYKMIVVLTHDVSGTKPEQEVTYQAAWIAFHAMEDEVQSTAEIEAENKQQDAVSVGQNI